MNTVPEVVPIPEEIIPEENAPSEYDDTTIKQLPVELAEAETTEDVKKSSTLAKKVYLDSPVTVQFEDIHVSDVLRVVHEESIPDTPILIDLQAVGYPYRLTNTANIPVPNTGLIPNAYATDGMIDSFTMKNITVLEVLDAICFPLDLAIHFEPGFTWIVRRK